MVRVDPAAAGKGGLRAFAQAMAAGGRSGPPSPDPPPYDPETGEIYETAAAARPTPAPTLDLTSPEAEMKRLVGGVLERLAAAARSPVMKGDPYREIFVALAAVVELFPALVRMVHQAGHVMPEDKLLAFMDKVLTQTREGAQEGASVAVKRASQRWFSMFDRRTTVAIAALIAGAALIGGLIGSLSVLKVMGR